MNKHIQQFLQAVTNHIQSKEAKRFVSAELQGHLAKSKDAWMKKGLSEEAAEERAVVEMGSPVSLGRSLNKLHRPKVDWMLLSLLAIVLMMGFLPLLAVDATEMAAMGSYLRNKAIFVLMGAILAVGIMYVDYRKLEKYGYFYYGIGVGILMMLHVLPNQWVNGQPMMTIGPLTIHGFMVIPIFLLAWASFFNRKEFSLVRAGILFIISFLLLLVNLYSPVTLFVYTAMVAVLFCLSHFSKRKKAWLMTGSAVLLPVGGYFALFNLEHYQLGRLYGFLSPEKYAESEGYLYLQLQQARSNAGWFGSGEPIYLPDSQTNLVLAGLIQQYGYVLGFILVAALSLIAVRIFIIAFGIKDRYGRLLVTGGLTIFTVQFLYHTGMTFGVLPFVSMPLPFMSYGLMPTLLGAFIMGLALSVYRRKNLIVM